MPGETGSSPLTRGKPATPRPLSRSARAHPRSRGENTDDAVMRLSVYGSSPLTRGKQGRGRSRIRSVGLIPAHAGKTHRYDINEREGAAHPRSRGENRRDGEGTPLSQGSSPLTRGKLCHLGYHQRPGGLIPAHAGKTVSGVRPASSLRAHPRSRGENGCPAAGPPPMRGSSPLTRGKRCGGRGFGRA